MGLLGLGVKSRGVNLELRESMEVLGGANLGRRETSKYPRANGLLWVSLSRLARGTGLCDWDL